MNNNYQVKNQAYYQGPEEQVRRSNLYKSYIELKKVNLISIILTILSVFVITIFINWIFSIIGSVKASHVEKMDPSFGSVKVLYIISAILVFPLFPLIAGILGYIKTNDQIRNLGMI